MNDLAIDANSYKTKIDYVLKKPINIFWTGSPENAKNLEKIVPILEKISISFPLQLTMVGRNKGGLNSEIIRHFLWDQNTFFDRLVDADIAIYPAMELSEENLGKVAYKSLEYGASAIPIVASNLGLSPHFIDEEDVLIANTLEEWEKQIIRLIKNESLRKYLGSNVRKKTKKFHSVESCYKNLIEILFIK